MVNMTFTQEMIGIIASIKGQTMISYECAEIDEWSRTYGNFRINMDGYSIEITNEQKVVPFFDTTEDIAGFDCKKVEPQSTYTPGVIGDVQVVPVDEIVHSVEIITDVINVNHGEYEISFDNAIIIHTEYQTIMFSRDIWFSEVITISDNDDFDSIYPVESMVEEWSNDGEDEVSVQRTKQTL